MPVLVSFVLRWRSSHGNEDTRVELGDLENREFGDI